MCLEKREVIQMVRGFDLLNDDNLNPVRARGSASQQVIKAALSCIPLPGLVSIDRLLGISNTTHGGTGWTCVDRDAVTGLVAAEESRREKREKREKRAQ